MTKFACADIELASNIRLQSLQDEYNSNSNYDLQELQKDLASGLEFNQDYKEYSYDEDEVDKYEVFDEGPDADDEPEVEDSKPENDYADDDEDNTEDTKSKTKLINDVKSRNTTHNATHPHNGTDLIHNGNHSNVSLNEYNSETESGSSTFGLSISLMIGLGVVTGLLI